MFDVVCKDCEAIFTSTDAKVPQSLVCMCGGKEFHVIEKELVAAQ